MAYYYEIEVEQKTKSGIWWPLVPGPIRAATQITDVAEAQRMAQDAANRYHSRARIVAYVNCKTVMAEYEPSKGERK